MSQKYPISERALFHATTLYKKAVENLPVGTDIDLFSLAQSASLGGLSLDERFVVDSNNIPNVEEVNELATAVINLSEEFK